MGVLRLILALSVIVTHTGQPLLGVNSIGGAQAVEVFFIISGFYMAMILNEKYVGPGSYRTFIKNRALRLLPTYWLVAFAVVALAFLLHPGDRESGVAYFQRYSGQLAAGSWALLSLPNLLLVGQDAVLFLQMSGHGVLSFVKDYQTSNPQLWHFMLIPQAWSLSLEVYFYAMAPLVVRARTRYIVGLMAASLALRTVMYFTGWYNDPWNYRFFPNELMLFLAGALSYRAYTYLRTQLEAHQSVPLAVTGAVTAAVLVLPGPSGWTLPTLWVFYGVMALALPFLFASTKRNRTDRMIGELSYPVYIWHWLVMNTLLATFGDGPYKSLIVATVTVVLSFFTVRFLILPLEQVRQAGPSVETGTKPQTAWWPAMLSLLRPMRLAPEATDRARTSRRD